MGGTVRLDGRKAADLARAAALLREGGLVAFPTETVYGLGANAFSAAAVAGIFQAKQRPSWDPLIVHLASAGEVPRVAEIAEAVLRLRVKALAGAFWPGPLTLLLPRSAVVPDAVTAGRPLVGVRVPNHPVAQALLRAAGLPLAAPSANRFGHVSPTTADHVLEDLDGRIDAVLEGGAATVGVESTVVDPGPTPMVLYRAGAVTAEAIAEACGAPVETFVPVKMPVGAPPSAPESLPSPGVGLRHYAPAVPVRLTAGEPEALWRAVEELRVNGNCVGMLLPGDWPSRTEGGVVVQRWGRWSDAAALAAELFAGLRALENSEAKVIVCPLPEPGGLRDALRDRLLKAATVE